jgi:predicted DCC family thiol-disulfide oxidoreductase YuxK
VNCLFCIGTMAVIKTRDAVSGLSVYGWQCRKCGELIDTLIDLDRRRHLEPKSCWARFPLQFC